MKKIDNWRGHALRYGRHSERNAVYVITVVTQQRSPLFHDLYLGRILINRFRHYQQQAETWAFVVMPDHFHWLLQLKEGDLSDLVRSVKATSAQEINRHLERTGPLWQKGFYDQQIRDERHFLNTARYIVANPLRAGLVQSVGDYPLWDSI